VLSPGLLAGLRLTIMLWLSYDMFNAINLFATETYVCGHAAVLFCRH